MIRRFAIRVVGTLVGLAVVAGVVLYLWPSSDYLFLPDPAHPVAPLVRVQGQHAGTGVGGIYFVDVIERKATMLESLFPSIRSGATLVPGNEIVPPGISQQQTEEANLRQMSISKRVAAAVALRQLGYHVVARPDGVIVDAVELGSHAVGKLQPADVIVAVDGAPTKTVGALRAKLAQINPGQPVKLGVLRNGKRHDIAVQTIADPFDRHRAIVGFTPDQAAHIDLPLQVQIDSGNVVGPSAGLAFALEIYEKLGHDVDRGYRIAATGQIELDGRVAPIGGVEQKTIGAREAKADVFLVPAGDNATEARRYAHGLRIIAVQSFPQALHALATLPRKG